jgi:hypothetical protein
VKVLASSLRCAYCHDAFGLDARIRCPRCSTLLHADCWADLGRCPTLGCAHAHSAPPLRPHPVRCTSRSWNLGLGVVSLMPLALYIFGVAVFALLKPAANVPCADPPHFASDAGSRPSGESLDDWARRPRAEDWYCEEEPPPVEAYLQPASCASGDEFRHERARLTVAARLLHQRRAKGTVTDSAASLHGRVSVRRHGEHSSVYFYASERRGRFTAYVWCSSPLPENLALPGEASHLPLYPRGPGEEAWYWVSGPR